MGQIQIKIKKKDFKELYNIASEDWKEKFQELFKTQLFSETLEFNTKFISDMKNACTKEQLPVFTSIFKNYIKEDFDYTKIKTYTDVCKNLGIVELSIESFRQFEEQALKLFTLYRLINIQNCLNQNHIFDWNNINEYKYYPYFLKTAAGWDSSGSFAGVGSCFVGAFAFYINSDISTYAGKTFKSVYLDIIK